MTATVYLDFDDLCRLVAAVLDTDPDTAKRMFSGEAAERILMGPASIAAPIAPSANPELERESLLVERAAELARRILVEQPLPHCNEQLAWSAVQEFVTRNGARLPALDPSDYAGLFTDIASSATRPARLVEWIGDHLKASPEASSA